MTNRKAPTGNTCPDIDNCIKWLKYATDYIDGAIADMKVMEGQLDDATLHLESNIENAISNLQDAKSHIDFSGTLEELREANSSLRSWGYDLVDDCEDLEKEISTLERQL